MRPSVVEGDLLDQEADAIVNSWNRNVIPWWLLIPQGVSGAIKKRGGKGIFRELAKKGAIPLGGAVHTSAGSLPYKAIIQLKGFSVLQVYVAPPVNDYLVNYKRRTILDLEEDIGKSVIVKAELSYPVDVVHYRFLTGDGQEAKVVIPAGLGVSL